jgi:hypothetical protein
MNHQLKRLNHLLLKGRLNLSNSKKFSTLKELVKEFWFYHKPR